MAKPKEHGILYNFCKWALCVEFFVLLMFLIVFRIAWGNSLEENKPFLDELKRLTCHGEFIAFFMPAFICLLLELSEKSKDLGIFVYGYFIAIIMFFMAEYVLVMEKYTKYYSLVLHTIMPLVFLNSTALFTKIYIYKTQKSAKGDTK